MNVIEVIPLTTLPPQVPQLLSYFFEKPLLKGSLVEVSLNRRKVPAVVTSSSSIEEQKISLKKTGFQLKKISAVITEKPVLTDVQLKLGAWLAKNYFAPLGLTFNTILPSFINSKKYPFHYPKLDSELNKSSYSKPEVILASSKGLEGEIMPEIRKTLSQAKQVLIIVPEISIAEYLFDIFKNRFKTLIIHSKLGLKKDYQNWGKISSGETEVVIGTRQAVFAPFGNLGLIIMDDPANEAYKSEMSPKYFTRELALKISEIYSARLLFVSQIPDLLSYAKANNNEWIVNNKIKDLISEFKTVDMVQEIKTGNFSIFSRELKNDIEKYSAENKKILIFSARKGYTTSLICENCGFTFKCPNCSLPLRVHKFPEENLICHRCYIVQKFPTECPNCRSYKLKRTGFAGSEKIKEDLEAIVNSYPKDKIFNLDLDSVKNAKQESEIIQKIADSKQCICIATQAIFSYRAILSFNIIGIPIFDSLTTIPDFKADEYLFLNFAKLLDFDPEKIIVQTYSPNDIRLGYLSKGDYKNFYKYELEARKMLGYPPFTRLVKLSFKSPDKNKAAYESRILSERLKIVINQKKLTDKVRLLGPSPAFIEKEKNFYSYNIVVKLALDLPLGEIIKFVPSNWMVDIDPKSIL